MKTLDDALMFAIDTIERRPPTMTTEATKALKPGDKFPCPKCGATEDEEGETVWQAWYYQPATQSVELFVGESGKPVEGEYGGDEDIVGDATENDVYYCRACAYQMPMATVRFHEPKTIGAVDHAMALYEDLVQRFQAHVDDDHQGMACDCEDDDSWGVRRALLAEIKAVAA